ncbi:MAG: elongation factor 1-beta [Candidatus Altiarchaeota archaeon]|nr:elongation factor 1-beta [Candidatus Altiarchaeota archaeon]
MGDVVAKIRIMPADVGKMDELKVSLDFAKVIEEKPIGFGVSALEILIRVSDTGGAFDEVEKKLANSPLISGYEILELGRL